MSAFSFCSILMLICSDLSIHNLFSAQSIHLVSLDHLSGSYPWTQGLGRHLLWYHFLPYPQLYLFLFFSNYSIFKKLSLSQQNGSVVLLPPKPGNLSLSPETHIRVEGENEIHKAVLWPPKVYCSMYAPAHTTYTDTVMKNKIKNSSISFINSLDILISG